jgi:hypothetical protein
MVCTARRCLLTLFQYVASDGQEGNAVRRETASVQRETPRVGCSKMNRRGRRASGLRPSHRPRLFNASRFTFTPAGFTFHASRC